MEEPTVITPTRQRFRGLDYYLCGRYFQRDGVRLHRAVWEAATGRKVPKGHHVHHVHHKDEIRSHNWSANLELKTGTSHLSDHGKVVTPAQREARRGNAKQATVGNQAMPKEKRAAASRKGWQAAKMAAVKCHECNGTFWTYYPRRAKFCSPACSQKDLRRRRKGTA